MDEVLKVGVNVTITMSSGIVIEGVIREVDDSFVTVCEEMTMSKKIHKIAKAHVMMATKYEFS